MARVLLKHRLKCGNCEKSVPITCFFICSDGTFVAEGHCSDCGHDNSFEIDILKMLANCCEKEDKGLTVIEGNDTVN